MPFRPEPPEAMRVPPLAGKLVSIAALGFALRVAARSYSGEADFWANGYGFFFELAHNIAAGNGLAFDGGTPTAYRVPLYPLFLSAVTLGQQAFVSVLLWQSLIGAGTVLCTALIARELFGSGAAMIAATLSAIYPYYVVHDTALQETSLYTFLTALAVLLLVQARRTESMTSAAGAGLALGAALLTRANLAPFVVLAPLCLALAPASPTRWSGHKLRAALVCLVMVAITVSPWLIRSY